MTNSPDWRCRHESAAAVLAPLRGLGVRIAIDDFGSGLCSLSYLHRFPVDTVKIDRRFIEEFDEHPCTISLAQMTQQLTAGPEVDGLSDVPVT